MLLLARARDDAKDQSYMLARLDPRLLERIWFPLGDQTKDATRAEAERAGLAAARRPESQEACFLAGDDYRPFLERHGVEAHDGPIADERGNVLGTHRGHWAFTPGQRRGLGVASPDAAVRARLGAALEHGLRRAARGRSRGRASPLADGCMCPSTESRRSSATGRRR